MNNIIKKAESYCRTLRGQSEEMKESKLYSKYGAMLGIGTCSRIAKEF